MFQVKRKPKKELKIDFIISVDRCLMSNHHDSEFIGFATTGPAIGVSESMWKWLACPKMKTDVYGRPWQAPYGLRKIEAALQNAGFKAYIIDPDFVPHYVKKAKALLIGHHDYFAFGPPSNEWWLITGKEPVNRKSFIEFISMPEIWNAKKLNGLKIIVGGPAVWQWEVWPEARKRWPVDTLVDGEAEKIIVELAEKILNGDPIPDKIVVPPQESPRIEEIPTIKAPSINGLVEIMRGCPRGCKFCSVTLRPLRFIPLDKIEEEIKLNLSQGVGNIILHSEDVLLYGADVVRPREEPLLKLHKLAAKYLEKFNAGFSWSHASLSAIKYAEEHGRIITKITELIVNNDNRPFIGLETGIETGSVRLARKIMPAKATPYSVEKWPDIVEDAFLIMTETGLFPAATFILGLPGETEQDVYDTIELLDRLKPYPSLIVPMFFVPMGALRNKERFKREQIKEYHIEAMVTSARHSLRWAKFLLGRYYMKGVKFLPVRLIIQLFIRYAEKRITSEYEKLRKTSTITYAQTP